MLLVSTGFKTEIFGPQSFEQIFDGGAIHVYSGARPTSADLAAPETNRLGVILRSDLTGLQFLRSGPFITIPLGDWWQLQNTATGTATWFRLMTAADSGLSGSTDARIDGDIGTPTAPSDMVLTSNSLVVGTAIPIDSFLFTIPPISGA